MRRPRILVTGATGKTGTPSTLLLTKKGYPVRAFVHKHDRRSEALKRAGAEIFVGSLEDPIDVSEAMRGVQRAYFCRSTPARCGARQFSPIPPRRQNSK